MNKLLRSTSRLLIWFAALLFTQGALAQSVFINELHYDDAGADINEFIEIAGPATTDLTSWSLVLYNGSVPTAAVVYNTRALSGVIPNQQNGYGTLSFTYPVDGIQNGANDGIALVNPSGVVVQLLSYEGVLTAAGGPAMGQTSADIGVSENGSPEGQSLQLKGTGTTYTNFAWAAVSTASAGAVNTGQTFVAGNPTVTLSVNPGAGTEAGATVITVTATASAAVTGDQTVNLAVTGTGITAADYALSATTIIIPNGATSGAVSFTVINDTDAEGTETATLTISSPSAGIALGSIVAQNIVITDDDAPVLPTVELSVSTNTGTEADATVITVTATSSSAVTGDQTVSVAVTGTGITAADYALSATTITIPNGATSGTVSFSVINDTDSEPTETATLTISNPSAGIALGTTVTQNIAITDNDAAAPTLIHDIQGATHISTRNGQAVTNVPGIVTTLRANGFWMQDPNPDANDNTSEGIFVFTSSAPTVAVGNAVSVNGTVQEFRANVQNLSITQLTSPSISVLSTGNALPAPIVISSQAGAGIRQIPTNVISNDFPADGDVELSTFDPTEDGLDFYETLEGMRVQINNPVTTGLRNNFGEVYVIADAGAGATGVNARGGITISGANTTDIASAITNSDFNPERIQIDDVLYGTGNTPNVNVGTTLNTIIGVVNYDFQSYEILPSIAPTVSASNVPLTKEVTTLAPTQNQLTIASYNVENLAGNEPQAKYDGLAGAIKNNLLSPDIIALEEIQDNDGATNSSDADATTTLNRLISAITTAGGPTYEFRQINPVDDQDGGQPGGNIRVGLLFNPARVQFVDRPGGGPATNTTVSNVGGQPRVSASPGRILDTNPGETDSYPGDDFTATRKPLVGEFTFNGQPVYVIVNHFSSRGGSGALSQRFQPPVQEEQGRREEQAKIVNAFVDQLLAVNANTNVVVLGDFNEFQFLPALQYLKGNVGGETPVLTNLIETLPSQERYTYTFDGNAQALDYILASNAMTSKLDAFDAVHINAEFLDQLSDHDPSVARFTLAPPPSLSPSQILSSAQVAAGATIDMVVAIRNVSETPTSGEVKAFVTNYIPSAGLSMVVNTDPTVTIGGTTYTLNTSDFTITANNAAFALTSVAGSSGVIPGNGRKIIAFKITRPAESTRGSVTSTVTIEDGTGGGETPTNDNTISNVLLKP